MGYNAPEEDVKKLKLRTRNSLGCFTIAVQNNVVRGSRRDIIEKEVRLALLQLQCGLEDDEEFIVMTQLKQMRFPTV